MKKLLALLSIWFATACTGNTPCVASHPLIEIDLGGEVAWSPYDVCDARTWRIPESWREAHERRKDEAAMDAGVRDLTSPEVTQGSPGPGVGQ